MGIPSRELQHCNAATASAEPNIVWAMPSACSVGNANAATARAEPNSYELCRAPVVSATPTCNKLVSGFRWARLKRESWNFKQKFEKFLLKYSWTAMGMSYLCNVLGKAGSAPAFAPSSRWQVHNPGYSTCGSPTPLMGEKFQIAKLKFKMDNVGWVHSNCGLGYAFQRVTKKM